jgi:hypothetical protein
MFGSGVVAQHVYNQLRIRPAVSAAVGTRIRNLAVVPQGTALPAALHYMENGDYTGPFSAGMEPTEETIRYVVRFICEGESDSPIRAAAKDALTALAIDNASATITQDGETFDLTLLPAGEWPITTVTDGGVLYRQLGFILQAHVFRA